MADDRNDESGANLAFESDHIGCKSISPPDWQHISSAPTRYPALNAATELLLQRVLHLRLT